MLEDFVGSTTNNVGDKEEIAELVVTALGTSGAHYICWKTSSGEYRQRSYRLPERLQEWLSPSDGTARDFATLQVILLGDDGFWASDKDGEIRNDSSDTLKQLRRAVTIHDGSLSSTHQRHLSRGREFEQGLERPRSSTLPATWSREHMAARKQLRPLLSHGRAPSLDKSRLGPAVPVVVRRREGSSPIRPHSIDTTLHGELQVLKEQPTPKPDATEPPYYTRNGYHGYDQQDRNRAGRIRLPTSSIPYLYRPSYKDSGMQTESEPELEPAPDVAVAREPRECSCQQKAHDTQRDSAVSFGLGGESSCSNSRRPSLDTPITRPDLGPSYGSGWAMSPMTVTNPIVMGRMQDYFRSAIYVLGAALQSQGTG